jgi:hypothetical protein
VFQKEADARFKDQAIDQLLQNRTA